MPAKQGEARVVRSASHLQPACCTQAMRCPHGMCLSEQIVHGSDQGYSCPADMLGRGSVPESRPLTALMIAHGVQKAPKCIEIFEWEGYMIRQPAA